MLEVFDECESYVLISGIYAFIRPGCIDDISACLRFASKWLRGRSTMIFVNKRSCVCVCSSFNPRTITFSIEIESKILCAKCNKMICVVCIMKSVVFPDLNILANCKTAFAIVFYLFFFLFSRMCMFCPCLSDSTKSLCDICGSKMHSSEWDEISWRIYLLAQNLEEKKKTVQSFED